MSSNVIEDLKLNNFKDSSDSEESLNAILMDAIKYAPSKILGTIINLATVSIYTNILLPKDYGLYMVATSVISFLAIIFSDWIGISALRFFRENFNKDNIKSYFSTILFLLIANLLAMFILSFLFFKPIEQFFKIPSIFLLIVLVVIIPVAIRALLFQVLRAQIKPLSYTFSVIVNQFITVVIAIALIKYFHLGAVSVLIGMFLSIILIDIVMIFQTKYHKAIDYEKIHFKTLSNLYKYGIPVALSSIGMWLLTQSNRFILQHYKGSSFNGQLGVGYNLTYSIMLPLFSIITLAAIPRIISNYEDNKDVRQIISKITEVYFIWFLPITLFLCVYPKEIVLLFSNSNFSNAYILLPCLSIAAFCYGLTELTTIQYYLVKKTTIDMTIRLVSGVFGIILNILLLPKFGLIAVGFSALISQFLYLLLSCIIKIKQINWNFPFKSVLTASIALILCFLSSLITKHIVYPNNLFGFISNAAFFFVIYISAIKLLTFLKLNDRSI